MVASRSKAAEPAIDATETTPKTAPTAQAPGILPGKVSAVNEVDIAILLIPDPELARYSCFFYTFSQN